MPGKKFWGKILNLFAATLAIYFFTAPNFVEANYSIGIIGVESRAKNINLKDYTNLDDLAKHPLIYAQDVFKEILTTDLHEIGLIPIDKTDYAKMARKSEEEFQQIQKSIGYLDKGNTSEVVKLFDQKLDYMIYGYISNFTITHREAIATSNITVRVDLSVRIVDAATGKVVCVAIGKGESATHGGAYRKTFKFGGDEISEECWHDALEKALNQIVERIKKQV